MSRDEAPFFVTLPHGDEGSELIAERKIWLRRVAEPSMANPNRKAIPR
jgi:hypothetical protein